VFASLCYFVSEWIAKLRLARFVFPRFLSRSAVPELACDDAN
jgi:hypothetical protein